MRKTIDENVLLTPHAAGVSRDIPYKTAEIVAKEIKKIIQGKKPQFIANSKTISIIKKKIKKIF